MPKEFTKCVRNGGKVKTKDLGKGKYMHICYDKKGNAFAGEVLTKKKPKEQSIEVASKDKRTTAQMVITAKATLEDVQRLKEHFANR